MTLSARTELSHAYSFDSKIDAIFKITLVAEKRTEAKGFHHIIVLDTSKSMDGQKDRKSTRLNSSHLVISYAVFCLKKKKHVIYSTTCTVVPPVSMSVL